MEKSVLWGYAFAIAFLCIGIKIFAHPLKKCLKTGRNSLIGALVLWVVNLFSPILNIHMGINPVSALVVGILGVPGLCLLMLLQIIF